MDTFEFAMADDLGIGIVHLQRVEQREESLLLGQGSSVGSTALLVETTFVADTDRVGIIMAGVGSDHRLGATKMQLSVAGDIVVIAAALPAAGLVHLVEHLQRYMLIGSARRAVNYN